MVARVFSYFCLWTSLTEGQEYQYRLKISEGDYFTSKRLMGGLILRFDRLTLLANQGC